MADYTVNNGTVTFKLPDEGTVFRATGDTTGDAVYKVVNGQLTTVASKSYTALTKFSSGGQIYNPGDTIGGSPRDVQWLDPSYRGGAVSPTSAYDVYKKQTGVDASTLPEFNMADIQTVLQRNGGSLPATSKAEANDPSIQGIIDNGNPNKVDTNGNFQAPAGTQPSNNALVTGPIDPKTGTVAAPTISLQPGATGDNVKALQAYLSTTINPKTGQPYLTDAQIATGPGIYGPATTAAVKALQENNGVDNTTGVGYWGPKTIASITSTGGSSTGSTTNSGNLTPDSPPVGTISDPVNAPTAGVNASAGSLNLPTTPSGGSTAVTYTTGLQTTIDTLKKQLQDEATKRAADYQTKIDALTKQKADLQVLQDQGMADLGATVEAETKAKQAELDLEKARFDENYNANQALVGELDTLLTQGNQVIAQMQETTGLSSIMSPRIAKTMTDIAARAGVIQAVMNARNGQMANAQNQLSSAVNAISSIYSDQLDYYKSVVNYYGTLKNEAGDSIVKLSADQKDYLDVKINQISSDLAQVQATAKTISNAMLDPSIASQYASAGVSLTDSPELIASKLATYNYGQELVNINNKMTTAGYSRTPVAGATPVQIADSKGTLTNWYKAATTDGSFTLGTNEVRFNADGTVLASGPKSGTGGGAPGSGGSTDEVKYALTNGKFPGGTGIGNPAGSDGFADPNVYLKLYDTYVAANGAGSGAAFVKAYPPKTYINPANTWVGAEFTSRGIAWTAPKSTSSSSSSGTSSPTTDLYNSL